MTQTTVNPKTASLELFSGLLEQLDYGPVVLAIVTATQGDVISQVGDKLLVWGDAQTRGNLIENTVRATVITQAFSVMKTGIAQRMVIDPGDNLFAVSSDPETHQSTDQVQVWLTCWQGEDAIAIAKTALSAMETGQPSRLVVPLVTGQFPYILGPSSPSLRNLQGQNAYIEDL